MTHRFRYNQSPSGEPLTGHLRCYACLKGARPFLRKRALHLAGQRLAGRVEIYRSRHKA